MLATRFLLGLTGLALLSACGASDTQTAPSLASSTALSPASGNAAPKPQGTGTQELPGTAIETQVEAVDFLRMAGLGPTDESLRALTGMNAADWVSAQIAMAPTNYNAGLKARGLVQDTAKAPQVSQLIYETMIGSDAEARTRMAFALSQIFVINDGDLFHEGFGLANYMDILDRNAFGNYRTLLGEVTRSPVMGKYLTYIYNKKGDAASGRTPDENYAREVLQLFTIGLTELNPDGSVKLGADGAPIETYDNEDIIGLARVFTGYVLAGSSHRWRDRYADTWERPMMMHEDNHSPLDKTFLGTTITAGTSGEASIDQALDTIFAHPNVGPFVSRQLIQRFTASDPEPAYVARVAQAFESGRFTAPEGTEFGTGERGDLGATYAAIVLDPSLHDDRPALREGKVREPVLNFVQAARAFRPETVDLVRPDWTRMADTSDVEKGLGQSPLKSPSVFNFYRPGFVAPGTESGEMSLTAPELQLANSSTALGYLNYLFDWVTRDADNWDPSLLPDFTEEYPLADDAEALVNRLDLLLTAGELQPENRQAVLDMLETLPVREDNDERDRKARVHLALMMVVATPEYMSLN